MIFTCHVHTQVRVEGPAETVVSCKVCNNLLVEDESGRPTDEWEVYSVADYASVKMEEFIELEGDIYDFHTSCPCRWCPDDPDDEYNL